MREGNWEKGSPPDYPIRTPRNGLGEKKGQDGPPPTPSKWVVADDWPTVSGSSYAFLGMMCRVKGEGALPHSVVYELPG